MGTSIELRLNYISLDYSKNSMGLDYGFLYQDGDLAGRHADQINYDHHAAHPDDEADLAERELAFARSLSRVLPRLEFLGHTLVSAKAEYEAMVQEIIEMQDLVDTDEAPAHLLTFEEFCALANLYPVASLATEYVDWSTEDRSVVAQGRFATHAAEFSRLPWSEDAGTYWSESSYLSARVCILSAEAMLQVFALNPENADAEVIWQFGPIVTSGWVERDAFQAGVRRKHAILVATEGSTDANILRHAFDMLRPDVADFFRFIDGNERHQFWGTGNLVKFAEGLVRIDIQNKVLFLLDNDAEGVDAHRKLQALMMPGNTRSMLLPEIDELRSFQALGPEGVTTSDISGRAAAIECYLDLNLSGRPPARIVWSNYKKEVDAWQGALEYKDTYTKCFLAQNVTSIKTGGYDVSKLCKVLDAMIAEATLLNGMS